MRARARAAVAAEAALMRRYFDAPGFEERHRSITAIAADQEIPAYAAQLEEEYRFDHVWALRCPGFVRIAEIAALPEGALLGWLDRLSGLSVATMLAHLEAAAAFSSAWRLALSAFHTAPLTEVDQDLLGLLAVEVWKRRRPQEPCLEALLDEEFAAHLDCLADPGKHLPRYLAFVRRVLPLLRGDSFDDATLGGESACHLLLCVARLARLSIRTASHDAALAREGIAEALRWYERLPVRRSEVRRPFARVVAEGLEALGCGEEAERLRRHVLSDV